MTAALTFANEDAQNPIVATQGAAAAASACRDIVQKMAIVIQGKKYLPVEAWQSIANATGFFISADEAQREYDQKGEVIGWKARGYVRDRSGVIVGTGEGFVGMDETKTWAKRAEYACRAMAQTRAQSRAGRSVFAFIVVMMGGDLKTTPAEEMDFADTKYITLDPELEKIRAQLIKDITDAYTKYQSVIDFGDDIPVKISALEVDDLDEIRGVKREMKSKIDAYLAEKRNGGAK